MQIRFRPLARTDFPTLSAWLATPHVATWWREPSDLEGIEARYGPCVDGRDPTRVCVAERRGAPVGLIQRYRMADEADWRRVLAAADLPSAAVGIDYLVGDPRDTGRGLGPAIIDAFVADTFRSMGDIDAVVAAVQEANRRSWRALEKAGFTRTWAGRIASADPSDGGPVVVYVRTRSPGACGRH
jgi:aminoglycoside 6'-N-acetyltransferase